MKKILVPTDFSACATYAGDLAVQWAQHIQAEVHFFSRVHVHPLWDQLSEEAKADFPESYARIATVRKQFQDLHRRYEGNPVFISTSYGHGDLVEVISQYIDQEKIDLIIMGSQGADSMKGYLFGSNAQKVVKHAHCPVMVIKQKPTGAPLKKVVFASDFRPEALPAFERLIELVAPFRPHIYLLHIETDAGKVGEPNRSVIKTFEKKCWRLPHSTHFFGDVSVKLGISHFAHDKQADLVAFVHMGAPMIKRLLTGNLAESLVNQLDIPVMSLNPQSLKPWHTLSIAELEG
ncbi:MAG: universal stress protein [Bacteroidota bacterium]